MSEDWDDTEDAGGREAGLEGEGGVGDSTGEEVKSEMLKDGSTNGLRVLQRLIREDGR
jgi:hypothetical protein